MRWEEVKYLETEAEIHTLSLVHVVASGRARCDYDGVSDGGERRATERCPGLASSGVSSAGANYRSGTRPTRATTLSPQPSFANTSRR